MKTLLVIILTCVILFSCYPEKGMVRFSNQPIEINDTSKIRFDGIYNPLDTSLMYNGEKYNEHYTVANIYFFNRAGLAYNIRGGWVDSSFMECESFKVTRPEKIGAFYIVKDSIFAAIPTTIVRRGMVYRNYIAYFKGRLKNRDTIVDWKIIPPYPVKKSELLKHQNKDLLEPRTLYFIKNDAVDCVNWK
jgi:hypothetical protein